MKRPSWCRARLPLPATTTRYFVASSTIYRLFGPLFACSRAVQDNAVTDLQALVSTEIRTHILRDAQVCRVRSITLNAFFRLVQHIIHLHRALCNDLHFRNASRGKMLGNPYTDAPSNDHGLEGKRLAIATPLPCSTSGLASPTLCTCGERHGRHSRQVSKKKIRVLKKSAM